MPIVKPISRQRRWQLKQRKLGRCQQCGEKATSAAFCPKHQVQYRERQRKRKGCKARYLGAKSYLGNC